jgi:hypothetical protein
MTLDEAYLAGLSKHAALSTGLLTYTKSDNTVVSASVYKSYQRDSNSDMQDAGYLDSLDNLYVLAKTSDVSTWGLQPMTSKVTLDGTSFLVGRTIGKTNAYWQIYLRNII